MQVIWELLTFLFNIEKWLREQKIGKKVDYAGLLQNHLGHFGIERGMPLGEAMLKKNLWKCSTLSTELA